MNSIPANLEHEILKLKNLYFGKSTDRFKHKEIGWNQRFTNLQAAVGLAQLERIDQIVKKKIFIGEYYSKIDGKRRK